MKKLHYILITACSTFIMTACIKDYENPSLGTLSDRAEIYVVKQAFRGSTVTLTSENIGGATFTSGTVISDKNQGNIDPGTFVIQTTTATANSASDLTSGLVIDMGTTGAVPYSVGDSVKINLLGGSLQRRNGKLILSGISSDKITVVASNKTVIPTPVTLGMLTNSFDTYESTLIAVHADVVGATAATTYSGEKQLNDNTGTVVLDTKASASFAAAVVPLNAQFTGIVSYKNATGNDTAGAKKTLAIQNTTDVKFASGTLYAGFPESFESPDAAQKASYNVTATANNIDLSTGNWKLQQAILGNTILSDKINLPGKQNIRMQQNLTTAALLQMNFDVTQGASKVTLFYGKYSTDPTSTFRLEYSINGGTTWVAVTPDIKDMPEKGSKQATFMVNLTGNVRFRINKLGLGASTATIFNGRLSIDDVAVYRK